MDLSDAKHKHYGVGINSVIGDQGPEDPQRPAFTILYCIYNSYFPYLTFFVSQLSLPNPGIDLIRVLIHL